MRQFAGIIVSFICLMVMLKGYPRISGGKKAPLGPVLIITGLIMAVIGGLPVKVMADSLVHIFTTFSTLQTLIVVVEIGILGNILKQYGILEKIVHALEKLVPSKKALVMIMPGIMGLLPVPGGAFLSAPFVDSIGTDLKMSGDQKTAVNLYFRHFSMFVLPYNTTMLTIGSILPAVNIYLVIGLCLPFVFVLLGGAYLFYVRSAPSVKVEGAGLSFDALKDVLLYLSPIYMALVFNAAFGIQMYVSILLCIGLTFFIIGKDKSKYLETVVKGIGIDTLIMLVGVYYMQNVVKSLDVVMASVGTMLVGQSIIGFVVIVPIVGLVFGLSTGLSLVPMGILLPFVSAMNLPVMTQTIYAIYILLWCFLGYYFSPFHLCQLLTIKYMGCDTNHVYRQHVKMMPFLCAAGVVLFFVYHMMFL